MPVKCRKKCRVLACVWLTCIKYRPDGDLGQARVRLHTGNGVHYRLPYARETSRRLHPAESGALTGGLVSIDAMGSQSAIAEAIADAGADYQTWPLGHQHPANPLTWTRCPAPCHRQLAHGAILLYRASHGTRAEHHVRPGSFPAAARAWPPASEQPLRACRASLPRPCRGNGVHPGASARQRVCHHDDFPR